MAEILSVLFEDPWLIAIQKPPGISVHCSREYDRHGVDLRELLKQQLGETVFPVHRLDRATSGVLLFARNTETAGRMGDLFRSRQIAKTYRAVVRGFLNPSGDIDIALPRAGRRRRPVRSRLTTEEVLLPSCTRYRTLERFELPWRSDRYPTSRVSLLELHPLTGRWHQIRRHLNRIAHPILGDTSHGDNTQNRFFRGQFGLQRLMLTATELVFVHPCTQQTVHLQAAPDHSFLSLVTQLMPFRTS